MKYVKYSESNGVINEHTALVTTLRADDGRVFRVRSWKVDVKPSPAAVMIIAELYPQMEGDDDVA